MESLRSRIRSGRAVAGTFVKTTSPQIIEVLAHAGLDFVVLDAEHAPFGIETLAQALGVGVLAGLPVLVRVPNHDAAMISACLDLGAEGVLVPHIGTAAQVDAVADAVKFARGRRGFSPSVRAGGYGTAEASSYRTRSDATSNIWCQIEDADALEVLDDIAGHEAVDCMFIGPADLSLSLGLDGPADPRLASAVTRIVSAAAQHDRAVGMFVPRAEDCASLLAQGISVTICGSDQSMLLEGARRVSTAHTVA